MTGPARLCHVPSRVDSFTPPNSSMGLVMVGTLARLGPIRTSPRRPSHVPSDFNLAGHVADSNHTSPRYLSRPGRAWPTRRAHQTLSFVKMSKSRTLVKIGNHIQVLRCATTTPRRDARRPVEGTWCESHTMRRSAPKPRNRLPVLLMISIN
jgi:hypothetical protein